MDNKIYVFGKNEIPHEIYSDGNLRFTSFGYDSISKMMLINASKSDERSHFSRTLKPILLGIKENRTYETEGCTKRTYIYYSIEKFQEDFYDFLSFDSSLPIFTKWCGRNFTYTFIPDLKNDTLRAYAVNNGFTELADGKEINCLNICTLIVTLDKSQPFTSKMLEIPFVVVYENSFTIYNFYTSIE